MQFKESGKLKAFTLSFDDGVSQDIRMTELLNYYGLKATFFLCSERLGRHGISKQGGRRSARYRIAPEHVSMVYEGHEVASHTLDHVVIPYQEEAEILRQVEEDRKNLQELVGYEIVGFAFPGSSPNHDEKSVRFIEKHTGIQYCRVAGSMKDNFDLPDDLFKINHNGGIRRWENNLLLAQRFLEMETDKPQVFHIMGHSYEMEFDSENWKRAEAFFKFMSAHSDVFYGTCREVYL